MLHHFTKYLGDHFRGGGASLFRALGGFVGASTNGALPVPPLHRALGYDVPYFLAPIASGDTAVWVRVVEDGHFDRSLVQDGSGTMALTTLGASTRGDRTGPWQGHMGTGLTRW